MGPISKPPVGFVDDELAIAAHRRVEVPQERHPRTPHVGDVVSATAHKDEAPVGAVLVRGVPKIRLGADEQWFRSLSLSLFFLQRILLSSFYAPNSMNICRN